MATDISTCLLCGTAGPAGPALGGVLRRCGECTFTWTATAIGAAEDVYDESYFSDGGYEDYFQPAARRFEAALRVRWLLEHGRPSTLVEAGSAAGFFVEAATQAGIAAQGVEVSAIGADYARDQLGVPVQRGSFESADLGATFEAVCAFHVLEHVEDPNRFVAAAWRALEPGGLLALEVPNIASTAAHRFGSSWPALQPEYHRWHFSPATLTRLVTGHGFELVGHDTAVFRLYMPPRYRRRRIRQLIPVDARNLGSLRLTHPQRGDLLRLVARRPTTAGRDGA